MKTRIEETKTVGLNIDVNGNDYYAWATGQNGKIWVGGIRKNNEESIYYAPDPRLYFDNPKQLQEVIDMLLDLQRALIPYEW